MCHLRSFGRTMSSIVAFVWLLGVGCLSAADLEVGKPAPEFQGLEGVDGKAHSLADLKEAKVVVVCFTCNECPVATAYQDRFMEFTTKYQDRGVAFIAVNCNSESEDLKMMQERAKEKGYNFPYAFDKTGELATTYGAKATPHLFVLDAQRNLRFRGPFDNKQNGQPTKFYVVDAVEALLAGKPVGVTTVKPFGCGIHNGK